MTEREISVPEAAALLKVSVQRVRWLVLKGKLRARKLGARVWAIDAESVKERKKRLEPPSEIG